VYVCSVCVVCMCVWCMCGVCVCDVCVCVRVCEYTMHFKNRDQKSALQDQHPFTREGFCFVLFCFVLFFNCLSSALYPSTSGRVLESLPPISQ